MSLSERIESKTPSWFVYIARAHTGRFYIGISTDPVKRLKQHNLNKGAQLARDQGPFKLVYTSLPMANKSEARMREIQLKGWTRQKKEKLISGEWS